MKKWKREPTSASPGSRQHNQRKHQTGAFQRIVDDRSLLSQLQSEALSSTPQGSPNESFQRSAREHVALLPPDLTADTGEPAGKRLGQSVPPSSYDAKRTLPHTAKVLAPLHSTAAAHAAPNIEPPSMPGALDKVRQTEKVPSLASVPMISEGTLIANRYMLESQLGSGNMGLVFLARDTQTKDNKVYALKVLHPWLSEDEHSVELFTHEYLRMKRLKHPGIAKAFFLERDARHKIWYLLMEYIGGISLQDLLARKMAERPGQQPFSLEETLYFFAKLTPTLRFLHEKRLVHRDLKPSHILWTRPNGTGDLKLLGLGMTAPLMRSCGSSLHLGQGHASLYTAPERMVPGEPATHATDIFSLGVILYQMLTGALPVGLAAMPSTLNQLLPAEIDGVLRRALDPKWASRFGSIDAMLESVKQAVTAAFQPQVSTRTQHRKMTPPPAGKKQPSPFETADIRPGQLKKSLTAIEDLIPQPVSNAQRLTRLRKQLTDRVAHTVPLQPNTKATPTKRGRTPSRRALSFSTEQQDVTALAFSPDGCFLASASSNATIKLWEVPSWYQLHAIEVDSQRIEHLCWSPFGKALAYSDGMKVHIRDVMHPEQRHTLTLDTPCQALSWHPEGGALLIASTDGKVQLWDHSSIFLPRTLSPSRNNRICALAIPRQSTLPPHHLMPKNHALFGGTDGYIALWDLGNEEVICCFSDPGSTLSALAIHPREHAFLSGNTRGEIQCWEPAFHGQTRCWQAHEGPIVKLQMSHHGEWFVSADRRSAAMWRTSDGEKLATFSPTEHPLHTLAISPDSRWLALDDQRDHIKLWDISSWNPKS